MNTVGPATGLPDTGCPLPTVPRLPAAADVVTTNYKMRPHFPPPEEEEASE